MKKSIIATLVLALSTGSFVTPVEAKKFGSSSVSSSRSSGTVAKSAQDVRSGYSGVGSVKPAPMNPTPARNYQPAPTAPAQNPNYGYSDYNRGYGQNYDSRRYNSGNYGYSGNSGYNKPSGYSGGTVAGAAAVGLIGGAIIGGLLFQNNQPFTGVHNGVQYVNGSPVGPVITTPQTVPQMNNPAGQPMQQPMQQSQPNVFQSQQESQFPWGWLLFWIVLIGACAILVKYLYENQHILRNNKLFNRFFKPNPYSIIASDKDKFFIGFQENNSPTGLDYVRANTTPTFFSAIYNDVLNNNDVTLVTVRSIASEITSQYQQGVVLFCEVHYQAELHEYKMHHHQPEITMINEVWVYELDNRSNDQWKLAGITEV